jgi:UDP-galactopyranose mutase
MADRILVVGAGFAGATYARELAVRGWRVEVIDKRGHVAGNAHDDISPSGVRVHSYGPHLFHTNNSRVVDWITRFGAFAPYEHRVTALLPNGSLVPLPINRRTINAVFGTALATEADVRDFLERQATPCESPANAAEYLMSRIGRTLTDLFFRPYTRKMWDLDLEELDAAVVKRIPLRHDDEARYFPDDRFQMLPRDGYTALIGTILRHDNIHVSLGTEFDRAALNDVDFCFNSMPIDEYFGYHHGPLPYRSIRFTHREAPDSYDLGETAVVNFTDASVYTRQTDWSRLPGHVRHRTGLRPITLEQPCDYRDNGFERYYPVKTSDGRHEAVYAKYQALAKDETKTRFIGRCGTYRYLDMDQVINQSLMGVEAFARGQH